MKYNMLEWVNALPKVEFVLDLQTLFANLSQLTDLRKKRGVRYPLPVLLMLVVLAKLAGVDKLQAIAEWSRAYQTELTGLLGLNRQTLPHPTTFSRVLGNKLLVEQLEKVLQTHFEQTLSQQVPARGSLTISIDGKTLRGTIPFGQTSGVYLMAAYLPQHGLTLAQLAVETKENEIVAAPVLLGQLDLRGMVVTGAAMQTQRALSARIVEGGGDYVWKVKENQPNLLTDLQILFEAEPVALGCAPHPSDFVVTQKVSKGHGRLEERSITVSNWLNDYSRWPYLEQAFKVEHRVYTLGGQLRRGEVSYGISSLPGEIASPARLLELIRAGWGIENNLHRQRDVQLAEDYSQLRCGHSQQVNAILNNLVISLLNSHDKGGLAQARREMEYKPHLALELLLTNPVSRK